MAYRRLAAGDAFLAPLADALWLVVGAPPEAANTLEMSEETLAFMYPDGPKALPPELA